MTRLIPSRVVLLALTLLLTVLVTLLLAHEGHAPLPTRGAEIDLVRGQVTLSPAARDALAVQTVEVKHEALDESIPAYATVQAPWSAHAFASTPLGGRVAKLLVKPGQNVKAGEVLAEVRSLDLESLQQELLSAQNEARLSAQIVAGLEGSGASVPEQTLREAQSRHQQNLNALTVGRAKWSSLGLATSALETLLRTGTSSLATLPVTSPISGTVVHADLALGRIVEPMEHLFEIVAVSTVWARIGVLEKDLYRVRVGQPVELRFPAHPGEVFRTTVTRVGLNLDPVTHLGTVWADLSNSSEATPRLLPGMTAVARLLDPAKAKGLLVPNAALVQDGAETYVFVEEVAGAEGAQYRKRNVVVERRAADWVQVQSGELFPGDRVVTQGSHQLASFFAPTVVKPSPEAARTMGLRVEPVAMQRLQDVLQVDGAVELPPSAQAVASPLLGGILARICVDRGQHVQAGEVLAEVAGLPALNLQLDLLRAHLEGALAEDTFKRLKATGLGVPQRRLLEVESQVLASRQMCEALRRKLLVAGFSEEDLDRLVRTKTPRRSLPVRAPLEGVVVSFDRVLGQALKAEEPLFTIHDLRRPLLVGHLSEREASRVRPGQAVRVRLAADPSYLGTARIVRGGQMLTFEGRTLTFWAELDTPSPRPLRSGQLAQLSVIVDDASFEPARLAIPLTALVCEGTRNFVFVRNSEGTFERRAIELGKANDLFVSVRSGLRLGETIAVSGASYLQTAFAVVR